MGNKQAKRIRKMLREIDPTFVDHPSLPHKLVVSGVKTFVDNNGKEHKYQTTSARSQGIRQKYKELKKLNSK